MFSGRIHLLLSQAADAFGGEVLCTFLLMVTVFSACDGELARKNSGAPLLPFVIGMAVLLGEDRRAIRLAGREDDRGCCLDIGWSNLVTM